MWELHSYDLTLLTGRFKEKKSKEKNYLVQPSLPVKPAIRVMNYIGLNFILLYGKNYEIDSLLAPYWMIKINKNSTLKYGFRKQKQNEKRNNQMPLKKAMGLL